MQMYRNISEGEIKSSTYVTIRIGTWGWDKSAHKE